MKTPTTYTIQPPPASAARDGMASLAREHDGVAFSPLSAVMQGASDGNDLIGFIRLISFWFAHGVMLPAELIFRRQIGERYFSAMTFAFGFGIICVAVAGELISPRAGWIFATMIGAGLAFHSVRRQAQQKEGVHWHSYSEGDSWLHFPILARGYAKYAGSFSTLDVAKNILEPLVIAITLVAVAFLSGDFLMRLKYDIDGALMRYPQCVWLLLLLITHVCYQYYCMRVRRGQLLDYLDSRIVLDAHRASIQAPLRQGLRTHHGVAFLPAQVALLMR